MAALLGVRIARNSHASKFSNGLFEFLCQLFDVISEVQNDLDILCRLPVVVVNINIGFELYAIAAVPVAASAADSHP